MTGAAEPGGLGAPRADSCHSPGHYQPMKQSIPHLADALMTRRGDTRPSRCLAAAPSAHLTGRQQLHRHKQHTYVARRGGCPRVSRLALA
jgi:hypothetical protein